MLKYKIWVRTTGPASRIRYYTSEAVLFIAQLHHFASVPDDLSPPQTRPDTAILDHTGSMYQGNVVCTQQSRTDFYVRLHSAACSMESKFSVNFLTRHPCRTRGNRADGVASQVVYRIAAEHGTNDLGSKSGNLQRDSSTDHSSLTIWRWRSAE